MDTREGHEAEVPEPRGTGTSQRKGATATAAVLCCAVIGVMATTIGAVASLLTDDVTAKRLTWLTVAALVAVLAGWFAPAMVRRLTDSLPPGRHQMGSHL